MSDWHDVNDPYFEGKKLRPCCVGGKRQRPWPFTGRWIYEYVDLAESSKRHSHSFGLPHGHGFTITRSRRATDPLHLSNKQARGAASDRPWTDQPREGLCSRGHWVKLVGWLYPVEAEEEDRNGYLLGPDGDVRLIHLASAREADQMVRRLSVGGPVFRERWLGIGAVLLVAASVVQAVASVF